MPLPVPVSVIFTLSKYPKVLCKLSSKYKSYPKVNPLVAVDKVVVRVFPICIKMVRHQVAPAVYPEVFAVVVEVISYN